AERNGSALFSKARQVSRQARDQLGAIFFYFVVTLTKRHLLAQCSYDGLFKSICQALCLYRKEADNRQDYYEELHEDRESVPDDLILVSHDDVILAIGHNVKPGA